MTKKEFYSRIVRATESSFEFAKRFLTNELPSKFRYDVYLSISCDDPGLKQFDVYPEDEGRVVRDLADNQVCDLLYRKGKVPAWIDIAVFECDDQFTYFKLQCAGRFSDDPQYLYYMDGGLGPFGIKSPNHPPRFEEGMKFEI